MMRHVLSLAGLALSTLPASAHVGDHAGMRLAELTWHFFETDHIVFAAIAVAVGCLSYRAGRRAEARAAQIRAEGGKP